MTGGRRALALAAAGALALAACGTATFTAEELVAEINRHGGELALGELIATAEDGSEIRSLSFTGEAEVPEDVHAGGTLLITEDDDAALGEYHRCEEAASLICYRAANAVMMFEGAVPDADLARLETALRAIESG